MLSSDGDVEQITQAVNKWGDVLGQLLVGEMSPQELDAALDSSGRTIRRALEEFETAGLIHREEATVSLTQFGRLVALAHSNYRDYLQSITEAADLLSHLSGSPPIGCPMMEGARTEMYSESVPDTAFESIARSMRDADRIRGFSPVARDHYVGAFSEHIFTYETEVELILEHETVEGLDEHYPDVWHQALSKSNCRIWPVEEVPEYGLIIIDNAEVWLGVYRQGGIGLMGAVHNDTPGAASWATNLWERYRSQAGNPL